MSYPLLLFILVTSLFAEGKYLIISHPFDDGGLFFIMDHVVGNLRFYDPIAKKFTGIEVNFGERGLYYEEMRGPNFWNYYFEPIKIGKVGKKGTLIFDMLTTNNRYAEFVDTVSRLEVFKIAEKYVHPLPEIQEAIDTFIENHFEGYYILGVHYRGTDKSTEAHPISHEEMLTLIEAHLASSPPHSRLFIATDDGIFLKRAIELFGDRVLYQEGAERSFDNLPVHIGSKTPYTQGKEAIIDCFLLSKTNFLLRCCSNLSRWSCYLNPNLPNVQVNQPYPRGRAS